MKTLKDIQESGNLKRYFTDLGEAISCILPSLDGSPRHPCYFILLVADDSDIAQYVSNADRQSCIKWLRETADRLENQEDQPR